MRRACGGTHEARLTDRPRVLLIEHVDAIGATAADAVARAVALRAAGAEVDIAVLEEGQEDDLLYDALERAPRLIHSRHCGPRARAALARLVRGHGADRVIWAGATPGGGAAAAEVVAGRAACWWPTGLAASSHAVGPLAAGIAADSPCSDHAVDADRTPRTRLSLWDGPFVLAFATPGRPDAAAVLEAFAHVAESLDGIDLVVLGRPDAAFEAHARRLEVLPRVHCVGRAPREAECSWLQTAACVVVGEDAPVSGGLLLRALATGHPLLAVPERSALQAWLEREQVGAGAANGPLAERLAGALTGGAAAERAAARSRALAARHHAAALAARAARLLQGADAQRRRAA